MRSSAVTRSTCTSGSAFSLDDERCRVMRRKSCKVPWPQPPASVTKRAASLVMSVILPRVSTVRVAVAISSGTTLVIADRRHRARRRIGGTRVLHGFFIMSFGWLRSSRPSVSRLFHEGHYAVQLGIARKLQLLTTENRACLHPQRRLCASSSRFELGIVSLQARDLASSAERSSGTAWHSQPADVQAQRTCPERPSSPGSLSVRCQSERPSALSGLSLREARHGKRDTKATIVMSDRIWLSLFCFGTPRQLLPQVIPKDRGNHAARQITTEIYTKEALAPGRQAPRASLTR